jgi:tRNA nucleotidyltransferase/poly(A) polymerase
VSASIAGAKWLKGHTLQVLLKALSEGGEEARIAGGAVRNTLLGKSVNDVDIATTTLPDETARRVEAAGFRAVPTGAEHGTITVVANGKPYEVTTLRDDIETDGRRAKVRFGRDWKRDAERRDFTINALYATADGEVVDLVGGLADIDSRTVRFIGDAEMRIREDFLRILRFFRFFAWYGSGRPDADGLKACARLKDGLDRLSAERIWAELKKLMSAADPSRALLWMRQASVLTQVLPESERWGIDFIHPLVRAEGDLGWSPDPMLRLEALLPPDPDRLRALAGRLRFSTEEARRLEGWARQPAIAATASESTLARMLYEGDPAAVIDHLRLALAIARGKAVSDDKAMIRAGGISRLLAYTENWERPKFPVKGGDLKQLGLPAGPRLGAVLKSLEAEWVASGFILDRETLLSRAAALMTGGHATES